MLISFFEEFPTEDTLAKLKFVSWPTKLYVAANNVQQFRAVTSVVRHDQNLLEAVYWPILKRKEGYWVSPFSKQSALRHLFEELENKIKAQETLRAKITLVPSRKEQINNNICLNICISILPRVFQILIISFCLYKQSFGKMINCVELILKNKILTISMVIFMFTVLISNYIDSKKKRSFTKYPFISFIIPTYNDGETIADSIQSIYDCYKGKFEIIVINDCSTDDTSTLLFNLNKIYSFEIITNGKNYGKAKSMNIASLI